MNTTVRTFVMECFSKSNATFFLVWFGKDMCPLHPSDRHTPKQTNMKMKMSGMEFSETLKLVSEMKMACYYWNFAPFDI